MNATQAATVRPRSGNRTAIRLRTLLLLIAAAGAGLGWWIYERRLAAVRGLLAVVPTGILLSVTPMGPLHDPTHVPDRDRYLVEIRKIQELHAEPLAVSHLSRALRVSRRGHAEKPMRGSLAALQWLGPHAREALPEVVRTVRGEDFRTLDDQGSSQIRVLGVHVLGLLARQGDERALSALIATLRTPDTSLRRMVWAAAAMEIQHLNAATKKAVPVLVEDLQRHRSHDPVDLFEAPAITAVGSMSQKVSEARVAIPTLLAIARDAKSPWRYWAINALGEIANGLGWTSRMGPIPVDSEEARLVASIRDGLRPLAEEKDPTIHSALDLQFRRFRMMRWLK
jgi:hypothetical protein